jgi:protein TonB
MKNEHPETGFDDLVFRNRNKEYGAYDLRRRYRSAMLFSVFGGLLIGFAAVYVSTLFMNKKTTVIKETPINIYLTTDSLIFQPAIEKPVTQSQPAGNRVNVLRALPPIVVNNDSLLDKPGTMPAADQTTGMVTADTMGSTTIMFTTPIPFDGFPKDSTFTKVEEWPQFPGGNTALTRFISKNLRYPLDPLANGVQGKVVVKFVVTYTGEIGRVEVIRSIDPSLDAEAVRVIKLLPRWIPGKQQGYPVNVWYLVPVQFKISDQR